jgi:hypothetical protein
MYSHAFDIYFCYEDGRDWIGYTATLNEAQFKVEDYFKQNQFNPDFTGCWYEVIETLDEQMGDRELVYKTATI